MTFPGVQIPPPPQLVLALTAWMQGKILEVMGETCDVFTVSAAGAAWIEPVHASARNYSSTLPGSAGRPGVQLAEDRAHRQRKSGTSLRTG
ncbi:MAG TPA: hypothetical protein VE196_01300 [Pseudonocardiaceae bacterium]|nr:hypothetical protein [Pseudonocardiaceae bacterium]